MATMTTNPPQFNHLRTRLYEERDSLAKRIRGLAGDVHIEKSADSMDETQSYQARDLTASELAILRQRAAEVECAIARWDLGVYGLCCECDEPIKVKRLEAIAWAPLCAPCQGEKERTTAAQTAGFIEGLE